MAKTKWIESVAKGEVGTCPVCRDEATKNTAQQVLCGRKSCRDAKYAMAKQGIDPKDDSKNTLLAARKAAGKTSSGGAALGIGAYQKFVAAQKKAGNPVSFQDKTRGGYVLASADLVPYDEALRCVEAGIAWQPAAPEAQTVTAPDITEIHKRWELGENVQRIAFAMKLDESVVQGAVDYGVAGGLLKAHPKDNAGKSAPPAPSAPPVGSTEKERMVALARVLVATADSEEAKQRLLDCDALYAEQKAALDKQHAEDKAMLKAALKSLEAQASQARKRAEALGCSAADLKVLG